MKYKIFFLALTFLFASGCIAHFPKDNIMIIERPHVRIISTPPPVVHVHRRHRPVVRVNHHHHRRTIVRGHRHSHRRVVRSRPHHHRQHRHHHHRRPRR